MNKSSFTELLEIDNLVTLHHINVQVFATELYNVANGLFIELVSYCLKLNNTIV